MAYRCGRSSDPTANAAKSEISLADRSPQSRARLRIEAASIMNSPSSPTECRLRCGGFARRRRRSGWIPINKGSLKADAELVESSVQSHTSAVGQTQAFRDYRRMPAPYQTSQKRESMSAEGQERKFLFGNVGLGDKPFAYAGSPAIASGLVNALRSSWRR